MTEFKPDDYNEITFAEDDYETRMEFSRLLLRCPAMSDSQRRSQVLQLLPPNIRVNISEAAAPIVQTLEIVRTCDHYDDGLKKLVRALYWIEGETKFWRELEVFLARFRKNGPAATPPVSTAPANQPDFDNLLKRQEEAETRQDWDEMIRLGKLLLDFDGNHRAIRNRTAIAYCQRAEIYNNEKNYEQVVADASRAIQLNPNLVLGYSWRGYSYYELKDYPKALNDYNRIIQLKPDDVWAYNHRGLVYYNLKQYQQALADYNKAIELKADYANAYQGRGMTYDQLGNKAQAQSDRQKAKELGYTG